MAVLTHLETDTGTNVDISAATAVGAYTANADKLIMVDVSIDQVAGDGDYVMYVTRQIGGSGSAYVLLPKTTMAAASDETAIGAQSGWITVRNGDVLTVYIDGLAGDTSTPDWSTRWFESAVTLVTLADDAITASKFDESTAYPLKSADTGSTQVARVGADSDTLETLSDEIAAVKAETASILEDTGTTIPATITTIDNEIAVIDGNVDAIKAKTDNLPANTATALAAIQSDLDNPAQYKADVSGLATTAHVQEVENKIDAIDVTVNTIPTNPLLDTAYTAPDNAGIAAIQEKTEQLTFTAPNKVDASATVDPTGIATSEELDIIGEKVDGVLNKLNVSSVEFVTAVVGSNITILRGDTLAARLLDLGDLTQYASLDFTVKRVAGELDDAAKIRLRKNASGTDDGLLRINGAEYATATDGSIVIDDLTTGDIEIKLNAAATRELVPGNYVYDVQLIIANEVRTLTAGKLEVVADVTRAVA